MLLHNRAANSERYEQGTWWAETEKYLEDVTFQDSVSITTMRGGGSNAAGFVQIMRGHVTDPSKMAGIQSRTAEFEAAMAGARPDILGDVIVMHADGTYTDAVYFTSEQAARDGETNEIPAELQRLFEELMSAIAVDEYLDLKSPWLQ